MGDITSDIITLNFDGLSSPSIRLKLPHQLQGSHPLGWGFGWYPNDNQAAIVAKDPAAWNTNVLVDSVIDWTSFRSTLFFCKVQGAAKGYTHHETQPFTRSFAGRDWLFMHNGDLDRNVLNEWHGNKSRFLEPMGKTDSELAFCYLLGRIYETEARKLSEVPPAHLLDWFRQLDQLGSADICLSDGTTTVCFFGTRSARAMYYSRILPPHNTVPFESASATIEISDPRDSYRTFLLFSSCPFEGCYWHPMQPGQLLIARRGAIVWDSLQHLAEAEGHPPTAMAESLQPPTGHRSFVNPRSITHTPDGEPLTYRLYDITHSTRYLYTHPVEHSTHQFRLQPLEDAIQEVETATFSISCEGEQIQYEDVFGNQCIHYSIHRPYTELVIESVSRVRVYAAPPDDHSLSRRQSTIPLVWMPWQRQMMMSYLLPSELPETQLQELTHYAMGFVERNDYNLLATLKDINSSIYRDYRYVPGSTAVTTTPFEVYIARQGVCQDFATLFICMSRLLGIPARYRMGYIYTGGNYENKIQSDASHAWVEIYLPYVGWRGFDPTNGCMVEQDHVRVACGRNYLDATPTAGTLFRGGGQETLTIDVKISEVPPPAD